MPPDTATVTERLTWLGIRRRALPLVRAGVVIGAGLGVLLDVVFLHLVFETHHLFSSHPNTALATDERFNAVGDGGLAALGLVLVTGGVTFLWQAWRTPGVPASRRAFLGSVLGGLGLYALVEGFVMHHVLGLHHVWPAGPGSPIVWDLAYLAVGAWLLLTGVLVVRADGAVVSDANRARRTY